MGSADAAAEETTRRERREARGWSDVVEDGRDGREVGLVMSAGGEKWDALEPDLKLYKFLNLGAGVLTQRAAEVGLVTLAFGAVPEEIWLDIEDCCLRCGGGGGG